MNNSFLIKMEINLNSFVDKLVIWFSELDWEIRESANVYKGEYILGCNDFIEYRVEYNYLPLDFDYIVTIDMNYILQKEEDLLLITNEISSFISKMRILKIDTIEAEF